jgi:hypothetical protein
MLGMQILLYQQDNRQHFPADLSSLFEMEGDNISLYASPRSNTLIPRGELTPDEKLAWVSAVNDYIYIGAGLPKDPPPDAIVIYENPARVPGNLDVLYGDGSVGSVTREQLATLVPGSMDHVVAPIIPPIAPQKVDLKIAQSAIQLQQIMQAIEYYSLDFQNVFPPDLGTVFADEEISLNDFVDPRGSTIVPPGLSTDQAVAFINSSTDYIYLGKNMRGFTATADSVIAYENPADNAGGILILFGDGRVEFRETRWALETIARATVG